MEGSNSTSSVLVTIVTLIRSTLLKPASLSCYEVRRRELRIEIE